MRGPGIKLDNDVRRLWTCPACHKQRKLSGDIPSPLCFCRDDGVQMQLTADSKLLRRAERLTPLPYIKKPLPEGWHIPLPPEEIAEVPVPRLKPEPKPEPDSIPTPEPTPMPSPELIPEPKAQMEVTDEFGADIDLAPPPPPPA